MSRRLFSYVIGFLLLHASTVFASGLPPEHEAKRLLLAAEQAIEGKQWGKARADLERMTTLKVAMPTGYHFLAGKVDLMLGNLDPAQQHLETYVVNAGDSGKFYEEALKLITKVEDKSAELHKLSEDAKPKPAKPTKLNWNTKQSNNGYLESLKQLYLTESDQKALLLQINSLLADHAFEPGRVKRQDIKKGISYRISVVDSELQVRETRFSKTGAPSLRMNKLNVFGVDPFIRYGCNYEQYACWIFDPTDQVTHWLTIDRNNESAKELAQALSMLMQIMQKG